MRFLLACVLVLMIALIGGCTTNQGANSSYQTVLPSPNRDTQRARVMTEKAHNELRGGNLTGAEKSLTEALQADTFYGPAHNNLGLLYYRQKKFYLAAWEFQYASKLMPFRPQPRNNLGLVLEAVGKPAEACTEYEEAAKLEPDNPEFVGNLARGLVRQGQKNERIRGLLQQVVLKDTRPDWVDWARLELVTMPATAPAGGPEQPASMPADDAEGPE